MVQGDPANAANSVKVSDFAFGGGSASACPAAPPGGGPSPCTSSGNESGDAASTINLSTSDGFEALVQTFAPLSAERAPYFPFTTVPVMAFTSTR
jgi:hypothetical protein